MFEQNAARVANRVYAAVRKNEMTRDLALKILNDLSPFFSANQIAKYNDFVEECRVNCV